MIGCLDAMSELEDEWGRLRRELALKVFQRTSSYDKAISDYFSKQVHDEPDMESISGFPSPRLIFSPVNQ